MLNALLLALLAFVPIRYGSFFLHELGHAVAGYLAGMEVTSFGMGTGRPFWVGRWRGVRVYLCRERPFQGLTFFGDPAILPRRWPMIWALSGGILAHVLLTVVALALWHGLPWGWPVWAEAAGLNALYAVVNLCPFASRVGGMHFSSDGSQILQTLRYGDTRTSAPRALAALRQLRSLWEATGDLRGLQNDFLGAGLTWHGLGDNEQAGQLLDQAAALPVAPPPPFAALLTAGRGLAADRLEAGVAALDEAEGAFRRLNHSGGLLLTAWWRAGWWLGQGEAARAVETLDALASDPLVVRRLVLRDSLLAERVQARAALGDSDGVERLLNDYETLPAARRSRTGDLHVYRSLGRFFLGRGDEARAVAAYRKALSALRQLDEALGEGPDRERFRACQAALVAEAQGCLRQAGQAEEADKLAAFFPNEEDFRRQRLEARRVRDRSLLRWGLRLTLFNLFCAGLLLGVGVWTMLAQVVPKQGGLRDAVVIGWAILLWLLVGYLSVTLVYGALVGAVGHWRPSARRGAGRTVLWLALFPWATAVGLLLVAGALACWKLWAGP
jgi:hypothetical protein